MLDVNNNYKDFKNLTPFKLCVLQNFPFIEADFDAVTNYQLLCKVVEYLNYVIANNNTQNDNIKQLEQNFITVYNYVKDYFDNLDVQEEINKKLDEMAKDGSLSKLIQPLFDEYKKTIDSEVNTQNDKIIVLENRMNTFTSLPSGSTSGDAELIDIRVPANGFNDNKPYNTAGDSVRGQVGFLKSILDKSIINTIGRNKFNKNSKENVNGYYISVSSNKEVIVPFNGISYSEKIHVNGGDTIVFTDYLAVRTNRGIVYNSDDTVLPLTDLVTTHNTTFALAVLPENAVSVRFNYETSNAENVFFGFNSYPVDLGQYIFIPYTEHVRLKTKYNFDGLNVIVAGDSIMRGYGNNNIGPLEIIRNLYGGNINDKAVSGARVVLNESDLDGRTSITNVITHTNFTDIEYLIFDGGFNDTAHGKNGAVTDFYEENSTNMWRNDTVCGCLEKIFHFMAVNYPRTKILYIFPTAIGIESWRSDTRFYGNIISVLNKWNIAYIDLFKTSQAIGHFSNTKSLYYYNSDGVHPNEFCYKHFYIQPIAEWLHTNQENY